MAFLTRSLPRRTVLRGFGATMALPFLDAMLPPFSLRANPDFAMAHENLGDVYAMLASRSYGRARQLEPNNTSVPSKLALLRQLLALSQPAAASSAASAAAR